MYASTRRQVLKTGLAANAALSLAALGEHVHATAAAAYQPQPRTVTISMVPLLVHEQTSQLPYLSQAFANGGVLYQKEVYAFMPPTTVCYAGDTLNVTVVNPANDPHTFTVTELGQSIKVDGASTGSIILPNLAAGIYTVMCAEPEHMPFMWGQIVVLPPPA
jgi:plastocyanin